MNRLATVVKKISERLYYVAGLARFLRGTLTPAESRRAIEMLGKEREQTFLHLLEHGIYANPRSPIRRLLEHAGITYGDVRSMVEDHGLEAAVSRLYDAGVYITLEEFKGRKPVSRPGLAFTTYPSDFDNPTIFRDQVEPTSGSRGVSTPVAHDFRAFNQHAMYSCLFFESQKAFGRPVVVWRDGITVLLYAKIGQSPVKWFVTRRTHGIGEFVTNASFVLAGRLAGRKIPWPRLLKRQDALVLARWLAETCARGTPAYVICHTSPIVRICLAARNHGLDISGTVFQTGGEPYTPAKQAVVESVGCRIVNIYATMENTYLGASCADTDDPRDMHFFTEKVTILQRDRLLGPGSSVPELFFTTTSPLAPKLMINVSMGDYASISQRPCRCLFGQMGLTTHIHDVHSYDKLTSEGVTFLGDELYRLLEEDLPARFGGAPMDYQLVEEEEGGLPKISLVIAPRVGTVDESAVLRTVLEVVGRRSGSKIKPEHWRDNDILRIVRREPYETLTMKVLPLHILRSDIEHASHRPNEQAGLEETE